MTTKKNTPFNTGRAITSELGSEDERNEKIFEMNQRGFYAARIWEREVTHTDWVATGYKAAKFRHKGEQSRMKYGVLFRLVEGMSDTQI